MATKSFSYCHICSGDEDLTTKMDVTVHTNGHGIMISTDDEAWAIMFGLNELVFYYTAVTIDPRKLTVHLGEFGDSMANTIVANLRTLYLGKWAHCQDEFLNGVRKILAGVYSGKE